MGSSPFLSLMDVPYLLKRKWRDLDESKLTPYLASGLAVLRLDASGHMIPNF